MCVRRWRGSNPPSASRNGSGSTTRTALSSGSERTAQSSSPTCVAIRLRQAQASVTHIIKVRVPDVDSAFARARNAGAHVLDEPTTHESGERSCMLEDMSGHRWELTQTVRDVEPEEWGGVAVAP